MAKKDERLSALKVKGNLPAGLHADGKGLYLAVSPTGAKSWVFRYMFGGKAREMGLGPLSIIGLAEARARRDDCRRVLKIDRQDPLELRKAQQARVALEQAKSTTFKEAAEQYMASHRAGWKNAKHAAQWPSTLAAYVFPVIGSISVQAVDTALVCKVLEPIWNAKPETAGRVRGRIESVLSWAKSRGLRDGDNPARWRGHLEHQFPARARVRAIAHHAAVSHVDLQEFMAKLREQEGVVARALEYTILTAARSGETIGARWNEIDLVDKVWTVPKERMKAKKEHRVPLSGRAVAILQGLQATEPGADSFVFSVQNRGRSLSTTPMRRLLGRMGYGGITVHGFRSTFRDWAAERTGYASEVVEMALAHTVSNQVEAAYRRGDLFEKRRRLMADWATFCNTPKAAERNTVVPLRSLRSGRQ